MPPSLLGTAYHAPYLHNGSAATLADVFVVHRLPAAAGTPSIANFLTAQQQQDLQVFLRSIDGRTLPLRSEADDFRDAIGTP